VAAVRSQVQLNAPSWASDHQRQQSKGSRTSQWTGRHSSPRRPMSRRCCGAPVSSFYGLGESLLIWDATGAGKTTLPQQLALLASASRQRCSASSFSSPRQTSGRSGCGRGRERCRYRQHPGPNPAHAGRCNTMLTRAPRFDRLERRVRGPSSVGAARRDTEFGHRLKRITTEGER
jgi:hypothetical protein